MDNRVKNVLLLVLVIGLVGMTSAYALLSQNLSISATSTVKGGSWDVHIENFSGPNYDSDNYGYTSASTGVTATGAASVIKTPTVKTTSISGLEVQFTKPGTSVDYRFDIVNGGTIDAKLDSISIAGRTGTNAFTCTGTATDPQQAQADANLVCSHLTYELRHQATGDPISTDLTFEIQDIDNGSSYRKYVPVVLKLTLEDMDTLPSADVTVSGLDINMNFIQK